MITCYANFVMLLSSANKSYFRTYKFWLSHNALTFFQDLVRFLALKTMYAFLGTCGKFPPSLR